MTTHAIDYRTDFRATPSSRAAQTGLTLFLWLLPFHSFVIAVLFGALHFDEQLVRAIAAWKEVTIIALVAVTILRSMRGLGTECEVGWEDLSVGWLIAIAIVYLLTENLWFHVNVPLGAQLYGLRDLVFFMLLYFVGRSTPELAGKDVLLRSMYWVAVVTSTIAILERLFVTSQMLVLLGAAAYVQQFLGAASFMGDDPSGLPMGYWTVIGGVAVRRAGSVYLSSQVFAISFLVLMPAATAWLFSRDRRPSMALYAGYAVIWIGLLLSLTRMTIIACLLQVLLYALMRRRATVGVGAGVLVASVFVIGIILSPPLLRFVWQTLTWQTASSESHLTAWWNGIVAFLQRPWGSGLGTTDATAARFGLKPITGDNLYLKYAVELGVLGAVLHLCVLAALGFAGLRLFRTEESATPRAFGAVVFLTTIGILFNAWTSSVLNSNVLAYLYFWLGGAAVTASHRQRAS